MNVENIRIQALGNQESKTISADFVAKTFVYVEPAEEPETEEDGEAKPGGE